MKKTILSVWMTALILFSQNSAIGQSFLNGSFEITTGNCSYNLTNSNFNSMMSDCFAFGNNSQIDIINSSCGYGAAQGGSYFIALAVDITNTLTDALSLKLSTPLTGGSTYNLRFFNKKDTGFNTNLLEVGYSVDSISFGNIIDTVALPTTSWGLVSFLFTPAVSCQFITIRTIAGSYGWNLVDNFTISETSTSVFHPVSDYQYLHVFPNPISNSTTISFSLLQSQKVSLNIIDVSGRLVSSLADRYFEAGENEITWNAADVNAGVYFLQIILAENLQTEKLVVTK